MSDHVLLVYINSRSLPGKEEPESFEVPRGKARVMIETIRREYFRRRAFIDDQSREHALLTKQDVNTRKDYKLIVTEGMFAASVWLFPGGGSLYETEQQHEKLTEILGSEYLNLFLVCPGRRPGGAVGCGGAGYLKSGQKNECSACGKSRLALERPLERHIRYRDVLHNVHSSEIPLADERNVLRVKLTVSRDILQFLLTRSEDWLNQLTITCPDTKNLVYLTEIYNHIAQSSGGHRCPQQQQSVSAGVTRPEPMDISASKPKMQKTKQASHFQQHHFHPELYQQAHFQHVQPYQLPPQQFQSSNQQPFQQLQPQHKPSSARQPSSAQSQKPSPAQLITEPQAVQPQLVHPGQGFPYGYTHLMQQHGHVPHPLMRPTRPHYMAHPYPTRQPHYQQQQPPPQRTPPQQQQQQQQGQQQKP